MTARALVAYRTQEGQTARIADRIAGSLRRAGLEVDLRDAAEAPSPAGYDLVVAGDSIHAGRHSRELADWLSSHEAELHAVPTALFQVSLTSATRDAEHDATARCHAVTHTLHDGGRITGGHVPRDGKR